jgi:hypothetical protein
MNLYCSRDDAQPSSSQKKAPVEDQGFCYFGVRAGSVAAVRIALDDHVLALFILALALHTATGHLVGDFVQAAVLAGG